MRCEYAHDDGAYVLGALSPSERSSYERHLGTCPACREAVAEIAVLPGLLGRLDPATALQLLADDRPDETAADRAWPVVNRGSEIGEARLLTLLERADKTRRRDRRGRRLRYASVALAAACMALIVAVGIGVLRPDGGGLTDPGTTAQMVAMTKVAADLPIEAAVGMERRAWGTEITMDCVYEKEPDNANEAWRLHLIAYGPDKEYEQVGSWLAAPGEEVHFNGATRFAPDQLMRLELTRADGTPVLVYEVP